MSMDVRMQASSLAEPTPPIKLTNGLLNGQSDWSRSGSFSSSSNDSSVFCGPNFTLGKRMHNDGLSSRVPKRSRNSSGSSVSSTLSCISEKELKKSLPDSPEKIEAGESFENITRINVESSNFKVQHERLLNESTSSLLPYRHNLRRNIRKKKCSCDCTATCTTLVVSRFKEIGKNTVEEKTVISRTKVQTCVQNTVVPGLQYGKSCSTGKTDNNRRRRSEMEKLYDSLHEIEWAKNFSPDNILRQINIRQAASCSVFGRAHEKADAKSPKKERANTSNIEKSMFTENMFQKVSTPKTKSTCNTRNSNHSNFSTENTRELRRSSRGKNKLQEPCNKDIIQSSRRPNLRNRNNSQNSNLVASLPETPVKNDNSVHVNERSVSPISDCTDFSTNSGDNSWTNNHFDCIEQQSLIESDIYIPELTSNFLMAPTFFDIAEEGIRTIDACFREVGAEVVISTCHEDFEIPLLTSVREDSLSDKFQAAEENPPVLEPCLSPQHPVNNMVPHSRFTCAEITSSIRGQLKSDINCEYNNLLLELKPLKRKDFIKTLREMQRKYVSRHKKHLLLKKAVNRIMKKYFKLLATKCKDELMLKNHVQVACLPFLEVGKTSRTINKNSSLLNYTGSVPIGKTLPNCPKKLKHDSLSKNRKNLLVANISDRDLAFSHSPEKILLKRQDASFNCLKDQFDNRSSAVNKTPVKLLGKKLTFSEYPERITFKKSSFSCTKNGLNSNISAKFSDQMVAFSKSPEKIVLNHRKSTFSCRKDEEGHMNSKKNISASFSSQEMAFSQSPEKVTLNRRESCVKYTEEEQTESSVTKSSTLHCASVAFETCLQAGVEEEIPKPKSFSVHYSTITVNHANDYTQVILKCNRGPNTFLTVESLLELREVVVRSGVNNSCHTLILNGVGDSFCLGLDLRPLLGPEKKIASHDMAQAVREFIEALSSFKKPFVVVVNGAAHGLGLTILTHADVILANDSATFCMPQSRLGYFPEGGATLTLPQAVGSTVAMDMMLRGKTITAVEAKNIGLVSEVLDNNNLPFDLVSRISMLSANSLSSMETTKAMFKMRLHLELVTALDNEVKLLPQMWLSQSCQEALRSASL